MFLFTNSLYNAPLGVYALTHNSDGTAASVIGTHASKVSNVTILHFAACIILNIVNILLSMWIDVDSLFAAAPAAPVAAAVEMEDVKAVADAPTSAV